MEKEKKVNTGIGYKNGKYRPGVFFDKELQNAIESHFKSKGYDTFNRYVNDLVLSDMRKNNKKREKMSMSENDGE